MEIPEGVREEIVEILEKVRGPSDKELLSLKDEAQAVETPELEGEAAVVRVWRREHGKS